MRGAAVSWAMGAVCATPLSPSDVKGDQEERAVAFDEGLPIVSGVSQRAESQAARATLEADAFQSVDPLHSASQAVSSNREQACVDGDDRSQDATRMSDQTASAVAARKAIRSGTVLVALEDEPIFANADSWIVIGCAQQGASVVAAGKVRGGDGDFEMVPIRPRGAIDFMNFTVAVAEDGTSLVALEDEPIYESVTSWEEIGTVVAGQSVAAAGPPVLVDSYEMVPIRPKGAVEYAAFKLQAAANVIDKRKDVKVQVGPAKPTQEELARQIKSQTATRARKSPQELKIEKEVEALRSGKPQVTKDGLQWVDGQLEYVGDDIEDEYDEAALSAMSPADREIALVRQKAGIRKAGPKGQGDCPTQ